MLDNSKEQLSAKVEVSNNQAVVEIELDTPAIEQLIENLQRLRDVGDHAHYFSEEWGGYSLIIPRTTPGQAPVHHIKITKV
ncbi:MAG: Imm32 family immunity protein [Pseudomonadota bacterium]